MLRSPVNPLVGRGLKAARKFQCQSRGLAIAYGKARFPVNGSEPVTSYFRFGLNCEDQSFRKLDPRSRANKFSLFCWKDQHVKIVPGHVVSDGDFSATIN